MSKETLGLNLPGKKWKRPQGKGRRGSLNKAEQIVWKIQKKFASSFFYQVSAQCNLSLPPLLLSEPVKKDQREGNLQFLTQVYRTFPEPEKNPSCLTVLFIQTKLAKHQGWEFAISLFALSLFRSLLREKQERFALSLFTKRATRAK